MITVKDISFSYTDKPLYERVSFIVGKGQKVGLVGPNGAGKSTLFKVLMNELDTTTGKVELLGDVALVPQEVKRDPNLDAAPTIRDYVDPDHVHEDFEMKKLLAGMNFDDLELDEKPTDLSGGQKTKLALARALLKEPDILLLDEPTNFMDTEGKRFVMNFLSQYPKTLILVSHDLELMDHAIDKVLYVNPPLRTIEEYKGNYTQFKKLKEEKDALLKRQSIVADKAVKRMQEAVTKAMRFKGKKGVRVRVQLEKRLDRMKESLPELPPEVRKINIRLFDPPPVGELPIKAKGISKSYDGTEFIFENLDFTMYRGERLALIGPNGAGKSTLIKLLMKKLDADTGTVSHADGLKVGYYSQEFETFDFSKTLIELMEYASEKPEGMCRAMLGRFNFVGDKIYQKVESLSGGEKTRLSIGLITAAPSNLLILDEPTTYLDVLSQRIILEAIKEYKGTMLVVSHNPEFIKELQPNRAFLLPEARFKFWEDSLLDRVEEM